MITRDMIEDVVAESQPLVQKLIAFFKEREVNPREAQMAMTILLGMMEIEQGAGDANVDQH